VYSTAMPLNIIVKGSSKRRSSGEVARDLHDQTAKVIQGEKAGYMKRQLQARKQAENTGSDSFKPVAVYDARTWFRHEAERPGCMSDPEYRKDYLKKNPEAKL
jgi:hypothetical protein